MVEPTETEPKETLDAFCDAMLEIARDAAERPEVLKEAPHRHRGRRLDEVDGQARDRSLSLRDDHPDLSSKPSEGEALEAQKEA